MSSKNPEKSLQGSESHLFWHEQGKGNKPPAAQVIDEDEEDVLFFFIQLGFKELYGGFLYNISVSEQENISQAIRYCLPSLQFYRCKHRINQQVHI